MVKTAIKRARVDLGEKKERSTMSKKTSYGTVSNDEDDNARTSMMTDLESQQEQHQRSSATKNATKPTAKKIALAFSACAITFAVASRRGFRGGASV